MFTKLYVMLFYKQLTAPQFQANGSHRGPNNTGIWLVQRIKQCLQHIWSIEVRPQAGGPGVHLELVSFPFRVAQKGAILREVAVLEEQYEQLRAELKAAGKLRVQLIDTIQKQDEGGARVLVAHLVRRVTGIAMPRCERMSRLDPLALYQGLQAAESTQCIVNICDYSVSPLLTRAQCDNLDSE